MIRWVTVIVLVVGSIVVPRNALAENAVGVCPGAVDRFMTVEARCPTFSWSGIPGAESYEILVYRILDERALSDLGELDVNSCQEALYTVAPGGATSWQPDLTRGLERGGHYVWFVRALSGRDEDARAANAPWSEALFFSISDAVTGGEFEQALGVVQRYLEQHPEVPVGTGRVPAIPRVDPISAAAKRSTGASQKSVPTAPAAVRGSITDPSGEAYGIVGLSASADGAGIAAANTAGGFDLVLDGSADGLADTRISESGIDRPSPSVQTFTIGNSLGGGLALQVDGDAVLTTASTIDADSLVGIAGADFATESEAAAMVAAHAASADHDSRYATKLALASSAAVAVHWDNLTSVPAGFADGEDNVGSFTVGPGLIFQDGEIRIDPGYSRPQAAVVDDLTNGGSFAMTIGDDGLELIAYNTETYNLKIARCIDTLCTNLAITTVEDDFTGTTSFGFPSIEVGWDRKALLAYSASSGPSSALRVASCIDSQCTSTTTSDLDGGAGFIGYYCSLAIDPEGYGLISYFSNYALKVAHCDDFACTTATATILDDSGSAGWHTSITIGSDGRGIITYLDGTDLSLKVAHCNNAECSTATISTVEVVGRELSPSIAVGADGLALISYCGNEGLTVAHCDDIACSISTKHVVDGEAAPSSGTDVEIAKDGFGLIAYQNNDGDLILAHCENPVCSTAPFVEICGDLTTSGNVLEVGPTHRSSVAFIGTVGSHRDLLLAHLGPDIP